MLDVMIIGAGLSGATIARLATDAGFKVHVYERRGEVGGNLRDWVHPESGWRIHRHGPHFFRTNDHGIWAFVQRFATWRPFEATLTTHLNGIYIPYPPSREWLDKTYGPPTDHFEAPLNFHEACLNQMSEAAYQDLSAGYVLKQWGISGDELGPEVAGRHQIRDDPNDKRLKQSLYQALPGEGYSVFISRMLDGIPATLNCSDVPPKAAVVVVWTGSIDEYYGYCYGRLPYRAQQRKHHWDTTNWHFPSTCVVFPNLRVSHIRLTSWQPTLNYKRDGWLATYETPCESSTDDDREYPMPTAEAKSLYESYKRLAEREDPNVVFAGRLGSYRYLDMDQAIARAIMQWRRVVLPRLRPSASILSERIP